DAVLVRLQVRSEPPRLNGGRSAANATGNIRVPQKHIHRHQRFVRLCTQPMSSCRPADVDSCRAVGELESVYLDGGTDLSLFDQILGNAANLGCRKSGDLAGPLRREIDHIIYERLETGLYSLPIDLIGSRQCISLADRVVKRYGRILRGIPDEGLIGLLIANVVF